MSDASRGDDPRHFPPGSSPLPPDQAPFGGAADPAQNQRSAPHPAPEKQAGYFAQAQAFGYQPDAEEMQYAFYAHLFPAVLCLLCCGMALPAVSPLLALSMAPKKGPFLLFHVNQSLAFQMAFFALNTMLSIVGGVLSIVCIGYLLLMLLPFTILLASIFPLILSFGAKGGQWQAYPILGDKVLREWKPMVTN